MFQQGLTGLFLVTIGTLLCLTGVGLPLGILFLALGCWMMASAKGKK